MVKPKYKMVFLGPIDKSGVTWDPLKKNGRKINIVGKLGPF